MPYVQYIAGSPALPTLPYPEQSMQGLAARWIQWAASADEDVNPLSDQTGRFAATNQPDDVWFLAGCFGGQVSRACIVPRGRKLFFPAVNMWSFRGSLIKLFLGLPKPPQLPDMQGYLTIDGKDFDVEPVQTDEHFLVYGSPRNPATGTDGKIYASVNGLWKLLPPLKPGEHELTFGGALPNMGFHLDVHYRLTVQ